MEVVTAAVTVAFSKFVEFLHLIVFLVGVLVMIVVVVVLDK